MNKLEYRPDIDGLRAIAIFSVIIYHAKINFGNSIFLPGGFLGVDVFFVISGYLITTKFNNYLKKNKYIISFFENINHLIFYLFPYFRIIDSIFESICPAS